MKRSVERAEWERGSYLFGTERSCAEACRVREDQVGWECECLASWVLAKPEENGMKKEKLERKAGRAGKYLKFSRSIVNHSLTARNGQVEVELELLKNL
jgi:hypothetical protein